MAIAAKIEGNKLIITCDIDNNPAPSSSGKSLNIVNSQGICAGQYKGKPLSINVTAYIPNGRGQDTDPDDRALPKTAETLHSGVSDPEPINPSEVVTNVQDINVGNLGDILKHAALLNIYNFLLNQYHCDTAYIDTHTYKLHAHFPYPRKWHDEIDKLRRYPLYKQYIETQEKALKDNHYRCSSGLIIDRFKEYGCEKPFLVFSEDNAETKKILIRQLHEQEVNEYKLLERASEVSSIKLHNNVKAVLMLVDPFKLDESTWNNVKDALEIFMAKGVQIVVEVFAYDKGKAEFQWACGPLGIGLPVAVIDQGKYHLAVYATEKIKADISKVCSELGWQT